MILYLIRHGESVYNREGKIQGQTDIELTEFGKQQAQAVALGMADVELDAIIASPLQRAYQTASALAQSKQMPIQLHEGLKEIDVGVFSGLTWPEVAEKYPQHADAWSRQDMDFVLPGGESRRMLQQRGVATLVEISRLPLKSIAIVAHGGILCAALKGLLGIPDSLNPFSLFNASISRLLWNGNWQLITLNQTEHLAQAGVLNETGRGNL